MEDSFSTEKIMSMYRMMCRIRKYEERIYYLFLEGAMPGTIHQAHGQEACAVGMLHDLGKDDYMSSTHRPAGHALAKGVSLKSMMAEMFAKSTGCCRAKGGAMHVGDINVGAVPAIAIVGGGLPVAIGIGLSCKLRKTNNVVVCFLGDGATNEGAFHEALNGAAIWNLPVVFACENNLYGASTRIDLVMNTKTIAERADSYGIPHQIVDGNDVLAVNIAATSAIERARNQQGPTFLELQTYRIGGHSRNDACGYRDDEEERYWSERDPLPRFRQYIQTRHIADESRLKECEQAIELEIDEAVEYARSCPDPQPEDALTDVFWQGGAR